MASTINADNGVVSGTSGLKSAADSTGILDLQTNGTTALSISATQAVTVSGAVTFSNTATFSSTATFNGATVFNTRSYTWPASYGTSGQFLQTNGSGTLVWATVTTYGGNAVDFIVQSYGIT